MGKGGKLGVWYENAKRAIYLTTGIDADAYARLAPEIVRLRLLNGEAICVFIHSFGGDPFFAEQLLKLIRSPRPDGSRCHVTTVCMGMAASAAADLLSAGDYAIAYPDSVIHIHGTRGQHSEITQEKAKEFEESLRIENEYFAIKLANKMFLRLATKALLLEAFKATPPRSAISAVSADPVAVLKTIRQNVDSEHAKLVDAAVERMGRIQQLVNYVNKVGGKAMSSVGGGDKPSDDRITDDSMLYKHIVDFEVQILREKEKKGNKIDGFTSETLALFTDDFLGLKEFFYGGYFEQAVN